MTVWKRFAVAACSLALAAGMSFVGATAAHADVLVTCGGTETTEYSPGLTLLPRHTDIDARGTFACTGVPLDWRTATSHTTGTAVASCLTVSLPQVVEVVRFSDNDRAVIVYTLSAAARVGGVNVVTLTGRVESGAYEGRVAVRTVQLLPGQLPTDCLTVGGVRMSTGLVQLQILI